MNTVLWFAGVANKANNFHKIKKICILIVLVPHVFERCHVRRFLLYAATPFILNLNLTCSYNPCCEIKILLSTNYPTQYRQLRNSSLNTCFVLWAWKRFLWIDSFQTQWTYMNSCVITLNMRILFVSNCQNFYGFFLTHNNLLYEYVCPIVNLHLQLVLANHSPFCPLCGRFLLTEFILRLE